MLVILVPGVLMGAGGGASAPTPSPSIPTTGAGQ